ncbi:hypothetical protein ABBQ38_007514 [Trebouxia sp. C0009 RCD-2024]
MTRLRGREITSPADGAPAFYRLASEGNAEAVEVLAQRVRWSEAYQAPTSSQPGPGSVEATSAAGISVSDLLEYRDPKTGLTPLMIAVVRGNMRVTRQLLEYGAPVDAVDACKGRTALHKAVKGSVMMYPMDAKTVALLLESGANPFCGDNKGFTAVDYAFQRRMTMSHRIPNSFELIMRSFIHLSIFAGPVEVKLNRMMGLSRGWKKMYCTLLPFCQRVGDPVTELQLLFIDLPALTLTDKVWVTGSRAEPCTTRARLHTDLIVRRQGSTMDVYMCDVGEQEMRLQLRALDETLAESSRLQKLVELASMEPAEAAEYPARRLAAGATFRTQPTPADMQRGRGDNMNRHSMPAVERSGDSPRDMHRQSLPARLIMPRSRSRDSNGSSTTAEEQAAGIEVRRAIGPGGPLQGVAEAPAGVNDVLAAAREDHRSSRRCLAQRSDSALMGRPLETHQELT